MDPIVINQFLEALKQVESSGGRNTNHPVIESGIHAGESAQGELGIMPKTRQEIIKRYPELGKNPCDYVLARKLVQYLAKRTNNDLRLIAAGYFWGHNLSLDRLKLRSNSDYVKKVMREFKKLNYTDFIPLAKVRYELSY